MRDKVQQILFSTKDPETGEIAMTSLLHRVCGNDEDRFAEACRIAELLIAAALEEGRP